MPDSLPPQGEPSSNGWISFGKLDRSELETSINKAGLTFFYLEGEIKATVFGFDKQEVVRKAVKRLITNVKAQHWNGLEITRVAMSSFLGMPYASVTGHARHIQEGLVLSRGITPQIETIRRRQPSEVMEESLLAAEAVEAWEGEGGAAGQRGRRPAAEEMTELSLVSARRSPVAPLGKMTG